MSAVLHHRAVFALYSNNLERLIEAMPAMRTGPFGGRRIVPSGAVDLRDAVNPPQRHVRRRDRAQHHGADGAIRAFRDGADHRRAIPAARAHPSGRGSGPIGPLAPERRNAPCGRAAVRADEAVP